MTTRSSRLGWAACLPGLLMADFSYEQTTRMTGGAMAGMMRAMGPLAKQAREPQVSTIVVKGNRMAHLSSRHASITDLDEETITSVDHDKKSYSVMTFAEMAQIMEQAAGKVQPNEKADVDFKMSVKETGGVREVAGVPARQFLMTLEMEATDKRNGQGGTMTITNDMWVSQKVPGYEQIRAFHKRMAQRMTFTPGGNAMAAGGRDMARGMAHMQREVAKMDGVPVYQVMKMGDASGMTGAPPSDRPREQAEAPSAAGAFGAALGGRFGGMGRKRKTEAPKEEPAQSPAESPSALMEMTTELTSFSSAPVDPAKLEVPDGYKQVESPMSRRGR